LVYLYRTISQDLPNFFYPGAVSSRNCSLSKNKQCAELQIKKNKEKNVFLSFNFHSKESFSRKSHKKEEEMKEKYLQNRDYVCTL
jgi:hypothetical protein